MEYIANNQVQLLYVANVNDALELFFNDMHCVDPRFTYLLTSTVRVLTLRSPDLAANP